MVRIKERVLLKIGSRKLHLIKLIGAFIVLGAGLMLLKDIYNITSIISTVTGPAGQSITLNFYGLTLEKTVESLKVGTMAGLVLAPLAGVMFWSAVLVFGAVIYRTGGITLPITERIRKMKEESSQEKEDKKEEKKEKEDLENESKGIRTRYKEARGNYVCPECGKEFDTERGLHIHESKSH